MRLASKTGHAPTVAFAHFHKAVFEMVRLDPFSAKPHAETCIVLGHVHGISIWQLLGPVVRSWAVGSLEGPEAGLDEMRRSIASFREQELRIGLVWLLPHFALAQAEAGQIDDAIETIAAATAELDGAHFWDPEVYRIRGDILLKRDPANVAPGEQALLAAIAVARQQKARGFELRAALSLAKLYQATGRPTEARDILTPALEEFDPTPEMPEIAEAQSILAMLAQGQASPE